MAPPIDNPHVVSLYPGVPSDLDSPYPYQWNIAVKTSFQTHTAPCRSVSVCGIVSLPPSVFKIVVMIVSLG